MLVVTSVSSINIEELQKVLQTLRFICLLSPVSIYIIMFSDQTVKHYNNYDHSDEVHLTLVVFLSQYLHLHQ